MDTHLRLHVGCCSPGRRADLRRLAEHLLLLQSHAVLAGGVAVLLIMEDGVGVIDQQLVLLGRGEELSAAQETHRRRSMQSQPAH